MCQTIWQFKVKSKNNLSQLYHPLRTKNKTTTQQPHLLSCRPSISDSFQRMPDFISMGMNLKPMVDRVQWDMQHIRKSWRWPCSTPYSCNIIKHRIHGSKFANIYHTNQPNVGKYTIHGWYGSGLVDLCIEKQGFNTEETKPWPACCLGM